MKQFGPNQVRQCIASEVANPTHVNISKHQDSISVKCKAIIEHEPPRGAYFTYRPIERKLTFTYHRQTNQLNQENRIT